MNMKRYKILAERFYKFFKYLRILGLVSLIIFLVVSAFNTGNPVLSLVSYVFLLIMFSCLLECIILYALYIFLRNK